MSDLTSTRAPSARVEFAIRTAIAVGIVGAVVAVLLACWVSATALLVIFAAALLAVFLRGLSNLLAARTRIPPGVSLGIVVVGLAGLLVLLGWLMAPAALVQASELTHQLPAEIGRIRDEIARTTWGGDWLGVTEGGAPAGDEGGVLAQSDSTEVFHAVTSVAGALGKVAATVLVLAIAGLFLAAQPALYFEGALGLLPRRVRGLARDIALEVVHRLSWWLIGQVLLMAVVSTITGFGLWALGMPLALILALLRGGLNFIPNFGPVVAAIPALILAAGQGGSSLLRVALFYGVLQFVESHLMTPLVNRRTVHMAPMLLIAAQLVFGALFELPGIMLAAPLTVVGMVLVQRLYVERVLGEPPVLGDLPTVDSRQKGE